MPSAPATTCPRPGRWRSATVSGKWLFRDRDFTIIKNGKDLTRYKYDEKTRCKIRKKYKWNNKIVLGHVGNFNYQKNHEFLIDVFAALSKESDKYLLVLVGDGKEYMYKAKKQVEKLEIEDKVIFTGNVNNVSELLQGMDIMLLTSRFEGLPNVVLEWQAAGLPSIISDKVTNECEVTNLLQYLPIDKGVDYWVESIKSTKKNERNNASKNAILALAENGYNIDENAEELRNIYISLYKNK